MEDKDLLVVLYRSRSGRLHRNRLCGGHGRRGSTSHVRVHAAQFDAAKAEGKVCGHCITSDPFATLRVSA